MKKVWYTLVAVLVLGLSACAAPPAPLESQQLVARTFTALEKASLVNRAVFPPR